MGGPAINRLPIGLAAAAWAVLLLTALNACRAAAPAARPDRPTQPPATVDMPPPSPSIPPLQPSPTRPAPTATPPAPTASPVPTVDLLTAAPLTAAGAARLQVLERLDYGPWRLVTALAWSSDGSRLAVGVGETIELLDFPGLHRRSSYRTGSLTHGLAFSPDSAWLAAAGRDGFFRVWQVSSLAQSSEAPAELAVQAHRKGANAAAFHPLFSVAAGAPGRLAASGGNDAVARFWDLSSGENTGLMVGGTFAVPSIAFLPDGALLAVTNGDRIRLREVGSERIAGTFASDAPLYSLAVSPDGRLIAAGGSDNLVRVWLVDAAYRTGQEQYPDPQLFLGHRGAENSFRSLVWQVAFSPAGDLLASVGGDGVLAVWPVGGGAAAALLPAHTGGATGLAFHPAGGLIATGGLDGSVLIWGAAGD